MDRLQEEYDALNDPDLPGDHVEIEMDAQGLPLTKTFLAGEETTRRRLATDYTVRGARSR